MPRIFRAIGDEFKSRLTQKDVASANRYEGFQSNGAVVLSDRRGTRKAEIPQTEEKGFFGGGDSLAIYKPTGSKTVPADKAMGNFTNWTFAAVNAIAREVANIQFRLYQVNGDDQQEVSADHPLLVLLDGVNEHMTGPELKYQMAAHLELTGNFYWLLDGVKNEGDKPRAIYPLNPGRVRVKLNKDVFPYRIDHYEFTIDAKVFRFEPYQILHGKYPDPNDPYVGVGFVQSIPTWIDTDNYAWEHNRKYFLNGAAFGMYIATQTNVEGMIDRIRQSFRDKHAGVENAHKFPVMPKGVDIKNAGMSQRDMDFKNLADATRDRILAAAGVSKTILGTAESDTNRACYDDQTEVLTENGWKKYWDVNDGEKIAEYDGEHNVVRFAVPLGKYVYPYKGKMLHFENCKMDIMVTPDHRMWYRPDHKGASYRITQAEKLPKLCYFKAAAPQNDGEQIDLFTLPYYPKGSYPEIIGRTFYMDDWLEFLGYVISEGGVSSQAKNWVITLYQKKQPHLNKIRTCLERLAASGCLKFGEYQTPGEDGHRFNVHGKPIVSWMHDHIGAYASEKRLPEFIFKLCRRQRQIIFDALMVGDGSIDKRESRRSGYYSTTSHQLADDVQRLAFSLGIEAKATMHYTARSDNHHDCYRVLLDFGTAEQQLDFQHRDMRHEVDYDGYVWCFQTNTGLFVTRRNGKIALQGNTAETADYVFSKRTIKPKVELMLSYLNEFLVPRYGDDLYLTFIDPIPEDKAFRTQEMQATVSSMPLLTQNEAREQFLGMGPVEGGDGLMRPSAMVPAGQTEEPGGDDIDPAAAPSDSNPEPGGEKLFERYSKTAEGWKTRKIRIRTGGKSATSAVAQFRKGLRDAFAAQLDNKITTDYSAKSVKDLSHTEYMEHWKRFADRTEHAVDQLQTVFKGINKKQREDVIANLPTATGVKKAIGELFDLKEWIGITINLATPILASLTKDEAASALAMIGADHQNILADENVERALERGISKMATSYNTTTLSQLKDVLTEKLNQSGGTNLPELTEAVDGVYSFADERRAGLIAKTESFRAANLANKEAWRLSGVVKTVKWYTAEDQKVCQFCAALSDKEIDINDNFLDLGDTIKGIDGGFMTIDYADIEAPPAHPDCRCYVRPENISIE